MSVSPLDCDMANRSAKPEARGGTSDPRVGRHAVQQPLDWHVVMHS
jgi:hypothetical protein